MKVAEKVGVAHFEPREGCKWEDWEHKQNHSVVAEV